MPHLFANHLLIAGAIASFIGIGAFMSISMIPPVADMRVEPPRGTRTVGETLVVDVIVEANQPVNVFAGTVLFDPAVLSVASIDYNTSIADLWAEKPWYSNGDGTLTFIGGTTKPGGFTGAGSLITITFETVAPGAARIVVNDARILRYDGLGSDAPLEAPLDAIFTVNDAALMDQTIVRKSITGPAVDVITELRTTDLNSDGRQTIADTSIFMTHLVSQNKRSDFNGDGTVGTADLSIILNAD